MKKFVVALGVAALALGITSCNKEGSTATTGGSSNDSLAILLGEVQGAQYGVYWDQLPDTLKAKLSKDDFIAGFKSVMERDYKKDQSYVMGMSTAMNMMGQVSQMQESGVKFDKSLFISNFCNAFKQDSVDQKHIAASNIALDRYMTEARQAALQKQEAEAKAIAEPNIKAGKEYVEKQKAADPSIKTTESGVSYKVVKEGAGKKPGKTEMVKVNYVGKHIDGSEFDSSKGEPRQFSVAGVVPGFGEILQMMAPGAKYVAYIPADKGYGMQGTPNGEIKPGETLVFEIEMVEVVDPKAQTKKPAAAPTATPAGK